MRKAPKVILNCQLGYFSIAKYYGGIKFQGKDYTYYPEHDALIRKDLLRKYNLQRIEGKTFEQAIENL